MAQPEQLKAQPPKVDSLTEGHDKLITSSKCEIIF